MVNLKRIKEKISDGRIDSFVESYLEISNQLENLENEWIEGKLKNKEYLNILDMCDYLSEKIAQYYIENYHSPSSNN
jgi:hypothetical protein